jgi:hypothetical protein
MKREIPCFWHFLSFFFGDSEKRRTFAPKKRMTRMKYTDKTTIKEPSRKLEEHLRWIGVQKYLHLKELANNESPTAKVIVV